MGYGNAISDGAGAASNRSTPTQVSGMVDSLSPQNLPGFQQGYASTLADTVDKTRLTSNPYSTIYGSPAQQAKVATVFPNGAANFDRINGLEGDMARTRFETLGGSPTAGRQQADDQLNGGLGTAALDVAGHLATGGGLGVGSILRVGRQMLGDRWQLGSGSAAADQIAPQLMTTDPSAALAYLSDLANRQAALGVRRQQFARLPGALGLANGMTSSVPAWLGGPSQ